MNRTAPDTLILERSLLGAIAAMLPLPLVDDVLLRRSRRTLLRELADQTGLRLDRHSMAVLAEDPGRTRLAAVGVSLFARVVRNATMPIRIADRARAALITFQLATLLDQYARHHHHGLDLDAQSSRRLRAAMDEAVRTTPLGTQALRNPSEYGRSLRARFDALLAERGHVGADS